jgi:hypothetical protein
MRQPGPSPTEAMTNLPSVYRRDRRVNLQVERRLLQTRVNPTGPLRMGGADRSVSIATCEPANFSV